MNNGRILTVVCGDNGDMLSHWRTSPIAGNSAFHVSRANSLIN